MLRGIIRGHIVSTKKQQSLVGSKFMEVEIMKNGELTLKKRGNGNVKVQLPGEKEKTLKSTLVYKM